MPNDLESRGNSALLCVCLLFLFSSLTHNNSLIELGKMKINKKKRLDDI